MRGTLRFAIMLILYMESRSESMMISQTQTVPPDFSTIGAGTDGESSGHEFGQSLEDRIGSLEFNLRYMQEIVIKWKKNFSLINRRISKLEQEMKQHIEKSTTTTTTTTTTNAPRQIQEPEINK